MFDLKNFGWTAEEAAKVVQTRLEEMGRIESLERSKYRVWKAICSFWRRNRDRLLAHGLDYVGLWSEILSATCRYYSLKFRGAASTPKSRKFFTHVALQDAGYLNPMPDKFKRKARREWFFERHGKRVFDKPEKMS